MKLKFKSRIDSSMDLSYQGPSPYFKTSPRHHSLLDHLPALSPARKPILKNRLPRVFKSLDPRSAKEIEFLEKYFALPSSNKSAQKAKNKSKLKNFRSKARIIPRATRVDPVSNPTCITEEDLQKGIYSLVNLGLVTKDSELIQSLYTENPPLVHSKALFHNFSIQFDPLPQSYIKKKKKLNFIFSEPIIPNKQSLVEIGPITEPKSYRLSIQAGSLTRDPDFEEFSRAGPSSESLENLNHLVSISRTYKIPLITLLSQDLAKHSAKPTSVSQALLIPLNREEVMKIIEEVDKHESRKALAARAALKIQCMWRRFKGAARMRRHRLEKSKVRVIEVQYKKYKKKIYTKQYAANLREERSNKFSQRQDLLKASWGEMKDKRIEIHVGSGLSAFPSPPNQEIFRIFMLAFRDIEIKYITLQYIDLEIIKYYELLMDLSQIAYNGRLEIICPYTICQTVMSDTSKALYLSSHDLVDLKRRTKEAAKVFVPYQTNEYDEYISDFLKTPILGCMSSTFNKYTKCQRWKELSRSSLGLVPSVSGCWTHEAFLSSFEEIQSNHAKVSSWEVVVKDSDWDRRPWPGQLEVLIKASYKESVISCILVNPDGNLQKMVHVQRLKSAEPGFLFPQRLIGAASLDVTIRQVKDFLYSLNIFGFVSIEVCESGVIDFKIEANSNIFINTFVKGLLRGIEDDGLYLVAKQEASELEQEVYIDENSNFVVFEGVTRKFLSSLDEDCESKSYVWLPLVYHEDLIGQKVVSLFHMCRIESVLFNLSRNEGVMLLPYSSFSSGCLGILGVGGDLDEALDFVAQALFIVMQGTAQDKKGNVENIADELGIRQRIERFRKFSEESQFLVKLLK